MKKIHIVSFFLLFGLILPIASWSQPGVKIRLGGNLSGLRGEIQGEELAHPDLDIFNKDEDNNILKDSHRFSPGFEFEVMYPLSNRLYVGLELNRMQLNGSNDAPPQYNFQEDPEYNALRFQIRSTQGLLIPDALLDQVNTALSGLNYMHYGPIEYSTQLNNLLLNLRFYLSESGRVRPYGKIHGGVSMLSTSLTYNYGDLEFEPEAFYTNIYTSFGTYFSNIFNLSGGIILPDENFAFNGNTIFSRGLPTSFDKTRQLAMNVGAGAGVEVQVASRISLMAGIDYSLISSGLVDGRPNIDYYEPDATAGTPERYELRNPLSGVTRLSVGLVYTFGDLFSSGGGSSSRSRGSGNFGRASGNLPFYKPYSR